MSNIAFIRKMRELRHCLPPKVIESMEWVPGGRTGKKDLKDFKHKTAAQVIDKMMAYIVDRVANGDICRIPDKNNTMIYMGFNYPLAIEKMQQKADYPYLPGIIPAFIKVSSAKNPRTYLSLLMAKPSKEWLIDKVNEGIDYFQPIPLHQTYHLDRKKAEMAAWERIQKEKACTTLTWTI